MATAESVKAKIQGLIDQSNATTGNTDADLTTAVNSLIAGFGAGGGDGEAAELVFETTFSITESLTDASKTTVATIDTGLTSENFSSGDSFYMVVECVNDTETDMSFPHFLLRTAIIVDAGGGYLCVASYNGGISRCVNTDGTFAVLYGAPYGLYPSSTTRYCATVTLLATASTAWGVVVSGDYKFRLYKLNQSFFGTEA